MTWNVHGFRAGMKAVSTVIEAEQPDLVLLQESRSRRRVRRLARRLGMNWVSSHRPFNRVRNAVLFSPEWRLMTLDVRDFPKAGRTIRRGTITAQLRKLGVPLTAVATHLGLAPRERLLHAKQLTDQLAGIAGALVVGVDINEGPEGASTRWISRRLFDAFTSAKEGEALTFPARAPAARIDYIFARGAEVMEAWVSGASEAATASDHLAVVAELEIPEP
jgi:endonuclease/exonuclease/phosphatase family metal-dependent hydrolase